MPSDRVKAPLFHRALSASASPERAACTLRAAGFAVDYVEDRDERRLGAVRLGGIRLIDNVPLAG
jgi:pantoate--beta-alanine ligase